MVTTKQKEQKIKLVLEDGTEFIGNSFGSYKESSGEIVFNTGMTGYQEILTDPSYCAQIVTMTYPMIGNYGINREDFESLKPFIHGFVVREHCEYPSNWRNERTVSEFLKEHDIPGIEGIDTRKLTKIIRKHGTMRAVLVPLKSEEPVDEGFVDSKLKEALITDQVPRVSTKSKFSCPGKGYRIVLVDCGYKHGILHSLIAHNCDVTVVPYNVGLEEIEKISPDGILFSNGPGDPKDAIEAIELLKQVQGKYPIFGICMGHQLFALANGADTQKMKFGHRGCNHPVKDLSTGKVYLSSQNHGYTVTEDSIANTDLEVTHINVNDGSVEGLSHKNLPAFSVQFHPEALPGPEDTGFLFERFLLMIKNFKGGPNA